MTVTLTWQTVITAAAVVAAMIAIVAYFSKAVRWVDRQKKQDEEIASTKEELQLLTYGVLACLKIYDISSDELITVATLVTTDGQSRNIGFRTEYSEFVPNGNYVLCGFGKTLGLATYRNYIRGLGNSGVSNKWRDYVNNLKIYIYKTSSGFGCRFRTAFMP